MTIPPFPSQDLAKLVLGYLAEEQLMTAYDEFLQASPYLDALRNEYDRIFMTSLRSILSEYRAVKIFVETCTPFLLRKKLFQCPNLVEIVRFLINNVDINKLQLQEASERASLEKQNVSSILSVSKSSSCEVCSCKLVSCVCKKQPQGCDSHHVSNMETSHNSVETTPLDELPGSYIAARKKHVKVLEKDNSNCNISSGQTSGSSAMESHSSNTSVQPSQVPYNHGLHLRQPDNSVVDVNSTAKFSDSLESRQKLEEFNDVMKSVANKQMMTTTSFQDFATGVSDGENPNVNVPDSSTSENVNMQAPVTKDNYNDNVKGPPKRQYLLQVSHINERKDQSCKSTSEQCYTPKLLSKSTKPEDQKIKILSDVKVGTKFNSKIKDNMKKKSTLLKNATSTPLMQMQTIVINGTPAYKRNPPDNYTKDEIMAMPTLIVVPASAPSKIPTSCHSKPITSQNYNTTSCNTASSPNLLGPLIIDVPPSPPMISKPDIDLTVSDTTKNPPVSDLVKTVELVKNATVPKDNGATVPGETNTPQVLPPTRKSSSTPRRSSHVRVLDFTTPRRILHETINEQVTSQCSNASVEIVLSGSPNVTHTLTTAHAQTTSQKNIVTYSSTFTSQNIECIEIDNDPTKENSAIKLVKPFKKNNWDADLRALAISSESGTNNPKPKKTVRKKKVTDNIKEYNKTDDKKARENKVLSPKIKKRTKKKQKVEDDNLSPELEVTVASVNKVEISVKPTINIISGDGKLSISADNETHIDQNKSQEAEADVECVDTPEGERLSLQNVIGAKLNISDLLETPYKQALYDIQMETPRFLGPELPDEPISEIKIMNIPTPRFLNNTPLAVQATPSSYSSRPTDYSSGGSYYKPDDQDYVLIPDLRPVETSSKHDSNETKPKDECHDSKSKSKKDGTVKKTRPVRQCTKNVSYRSARLANKTKECEETTDTGSSCSETQTLSNLEDTKLENVSNLKTKTPRAKSSKSETKNSKIVVKSHKPVQEKTKFININRKNTPTKTTPLGKSRRKTIDLSKSPNPQRRKRTISKEKNPNLTPLVTCAPTKSRRKSSTPRKLQCSKNFTSATATHTNPQNIKPTVEKTTPNPTDSDTEHIALRWSDDGSQDTKAASISNTTITNDVEDITQIKQFIESSNVQNAVDNDSSFKANLIRRGFDLETAKSIERDLLDPTIDHVKDKIPSISVEIVATNKESLEKTIETDSSVTNELQIVQDEDDEAEEIELSAHDFDEESDNYIVCQHDEAKEQFQGIPVTLKDKFSMEVCIDEELTVRLRATPFTLLLDQEPLTAEQINHNLKETQMAVNSICDIDKLYTPLKEACKAQYYEIFDSTLTSLDTPLKGNSPRARDCETTVTEIVLEEEKMEGKDSKKRKRSQNSPEPSNVDNKKAKNETQIDIKNIDIESVLTKLHGH